VGSRTAGDEAVDHEKRKTAFRTHLEQADLDGYWLPSRPNVRYLSGFTGDDSGLLITGESCVLITDSRYVERAEREAQADDVISRNASMAKAVAAQCQALDVKRLGITAANVTHAEYLELVAALPQVEVTVCSAGIAEKLRVCKDADEVEAIRAALRLAQDVFLRMLAHVQPGRTEQWLAARFEYEMRVAGAEGASFETICAVDANASVPHAMPGTTLVTPESCVLFDWGARLNGYCCDLTRVFCTGRIPEELSRLADVVMQAQAAVFDKLKPGNRCADADAAGRAVIAEAGHGEHFGHGIGHGVGLVVHEAPRVSPGVDAVLEPGMIVTVEPGVYVPGQVGVRIEEMVLITEDGCEVLSNLPRRPEQLRASASNAVGDPELEQESK